MWELCSERVAKYRIIQYNAALEINICSTGIYLQTIQNL